MYRAEVLKGIVAQRKNATTPIQAKREINSEDNLVVPLSESALKKIKPRFQKIIFFEGDLNLNLRKNTSSPALPRKSTVSSYSKEELEVLRYTDSKQTI